MNRDEAKQAIRERWREILPAITPQAKKRVNGEPSFICPACGNGSGASGDGLAFNPRSKDGVGLKCFKCGFSGDVLELYQQARNVDFPTALNECAGILGLQIDTGREPDRGGRPLEWGATIGGADPNRGAERGEALAWDSTISAEAEPAADPGAQAQTEPPKAAEPKAADFTSYYKECAARITYRAARDYLAGRGISIETAQAHGIGFDPAADPASAPGGVGEIRHPAPRIILPTCAGHYVARAIDPAIPKQYQKLNPNRESGASGPGLFNAGAIDKGGAVFVTEGAFDALSIIEAGGRAIALNSTSNAELFLQALEGKPLNRTCFILALDADEAGQRAAGVLAEGLQRLRIPYTTGDICGGRKDPNEALTADRAQFVEAVNATTAEALRKAFKPDNSIDYLYSGFIKDIQSFDDSKKTGFPNLDKNAGGLYPGLYGLPGVPSIGKTSFALQIADNLTAAGHDVVFFSLEQSRFELVAKSLARYANRNRAESAPLVLGSLDIRRGKLQGAKGAALKTAIREYVNEVGDRMNIIEGNFDLSITRIREYLERYIEQNGTRPVVFIDYLQIIQPTQEQRRQGTKEFLDGVVSELKRISRDLALTVFIVCSMNRNSYTNAASYEAIKETGAIEYTCDVIWSLQLVAQNDGTLKDKESITAKHNKLDAAKVKSPREVELVCLKNRYGVANYKNYFLYYPAKELYTVDQQREASEARKREANENGGEELTWEATIGKNT